MTTSPHDTGSQAAVRTTSELNPSGKTFFGHPRMLANLFSVEMWERFSYYGMQGIMIFYLYYAVTEGGSGLVNETTAAGIMGAYGGTVYLLAILGGFIGDRVLGPERTLFYSCILIMAGHISLALLPGAAGVIAGLLLVAIGSGGLKTNASALLGTLYAKDDPRRDGGFTIFYMGVNIGSLLGPLLTTFGWGLWGFHAGFLLAAIGMAIGLTQYALTRKNLPESAHELSAPLTSSEKKKYSLLGVAILVVILLLVFTGIITPSNLASWVMGFIAIGAVSLFTVILRDKQITSVEHSRVVSFIPMWIGNAVFWALYQQQFTVMALYSDTRLNWNILGMELKPSLVNSINPIFIIIFAPLFTIMWDRLGKRQPTTVVKFALGIIGVGIAFLIFLTQAGNMSVNVGWIVLILFVCTIAELAISPVGTSLSTKLAPARHRVNMVALYFTSVALGTVLAGWLAKFYSVETEVPYFTTLGIGTIVVGLLLWGMNKWITQKMAGIR
ncbi:MULTISPECIES: peptide MFS transporter [Rothia]|uniref:peptide MFS transporter n=1 Tax=Rothia TaxID=32207 RepID=UPI000927D482|nr:oligopeptide:H+ symporter [Rothia sp. ND6WE1A]SIK28357.1 di-/tripeptide transporter [Mycobacteroides abscessus subsp. abscessus]